MSQLTDMEGLTKLQFEKRFLELAEECKDHYYILVIEDNKKKRLIAAATLLVEKKFIHAAGMVGHIEDVVVSKEYRGLHLGQALMHEAKKLGSTVGCYKIILDCTEDNSHFYKSVGFKKKEIQMAIYLPKAKL